MSEMDCSSGDGNGQFFAQLELTEQESGATSACVINGVQKHVHSVVKGVPFTLRVKYKNGAGAGETQVKGSTNPLPKLGRAIMASSPIDVAKLALQAKLIYDTEDEQEKEVDFVKIKPMEYTAENTHSAMENLATATFKLHVLSRQLEDMLFVIKLQAVNAVSKSPIEGLYVTSHPIKVVSKRVQLVKRPKQQEKKKTQAEVMSDNITDIKQQLIQLTDIVLNIQRSQMMRPSASTPAPLSYYSVIPTGLGTNMMSNSHQSVQVITPGSYGNNNTLLPSPTGGGSLMNSGLGIGGGLGSGSSSSISINSSNASIPPPPSVPCALSSSSPSLATCMTSPMNITTTTEAGTTAAVAPLSNTNPVTTTTTLAEGASGGGTTSSTVVAAGSTSPSPSSQSNNISLTSSSASIATCPPSPNELGNSQSGNQQHYQTLPTTTNASSHPFRPLPQGTFPGQQLPGGPIPSLKRSRSGMTLDPVHNAVVGLLEAVGSVQEEERPTKIRRALQGAATSYPTESSLLISSVKEVPPPRCTGESCPYKTELDRIESFYVQICNDWPEDALRLSGEFGSIIEAGSK